MNEEKPNPYVGTRPFQESERDLFFGRDREIRELLALASSERIVLFYAQSGAGKSSLINTYLAPDLRGRSYHVFPAGRVGGDAPPDVEVGNIYVFNLIRILASKEATLTDLADLSLSDFFNDFFNKRDGESGAGVEPEEESEAVYQKHILIIDQFEELFSTHHEEWEKRKDFLSQLTQVLQTHPNLSVLLAMREDYIASLDPYGHLFPNRLRARYHMQQLERDAALKAVREPVKGKDFLRPYENGAAEKLVDDLRGRGQFVEPLYVQVTCYGLWSKLPAGKTITMQNVEDFGDVSTSLGEYYAGRVKAVAEAQLVPEGKIRKWFSGELITPTGVRNMVLQEPGETSAQLENRVIQALSDLVRPEQRGSAVFYELTHDRLVEPIIAGNQKWFDEHLSPLQKQAALWNAQGRADSWLLSDQALAEVEEWAEAHRAELTNTERDFLKACRRKQREREEEREREAQQQMLETTQKRLQLTQELADEQARSAKRARRFTVIALGLVVLAMAASVFGLIQAKLAGDNEVIAENQALTAQAASTSAVAAQAVAAQEANLARAGRLATQSQVVVDSDASLSLLLSIESLRFAQQGGENYFPEAEEVLRRAVEKIGNAIFLAGHTASARVIDFSRDGHWLASASDDTTIRLWDMTAEDPSSASATLTGHSSSITDLVFSPDGKWLASASADSTVRLWQMTGESPGEDFQVLSGPSSQITNLVFSPDGRWLAGAGGLSSVSLWDITDPTASPIVLEGHTSWIYQIAFSPDSKFLAVGNGDYTVRVWDLTAGEPGLASTTLTGHTGSINVLAFSPDGNWLASGGGDYTVRLWDMTVADPNSNTIVLGGNNYYTYALAFSPDSKFLATGSGDYNVPVHLWDLTANIPSSDPISLSGSTSHITALAFSPDGRWLASGNGAYEVGLWDLSSLDQPPAFLKLGSHDEYVSTVTFSPDGKWLVSAGDTPTPRLWEISTQAPAKAEEEISSYQLVASLQGHTGAIQTLVFSPDQTWLASSGADATVRLWRFQTSIPEDANTILESNASIINTLLFPDDTTLAGVSENGPLIVWNLSSDTPTQESIRWPGHEDGIPILGYSIESELLAMPSDDGYDVELWTDPTAAAHTDLKGHRGTIHSLAFSPDGRWLASGSADSTVILWDTEDRERINASPIVLNGHSGDVYAVGFSPDGNWLASASADSTVRLWDLRDEKPQDASLILPGHRGPVYSLSFSPGGRWLASAGEDGLIRLWDLVSSDPSLQPISLSPKGQMSPIRAMVFSPDGRWLVTGTNDSNIHIWGMGSSNLIQQACRLARRNLTWQESQDYLLDYGVDATHYKTCPDFPIHPSVAIHLRDEGDQLARDQDLDQAIAKYQEAREIDPAVNLSTDDPPSEEDLGDPESRAKRLVAQDLISEGDALAQAGKVEEATAMYYEAREIDPAVNLSTDDPPSEEDLGDPESRARNIATEALTSLGDTMADGGAVEAAVAKYLEALAIDPSISEELGDPEARARGRAAQSLIYAGDQLARTGDIEGAVDKYREALAIDPSMSQDLGDPEAKARGVATLTDLYNMITSGSYQEASAKLTKELKASPGLAQSVDLYYLNTLCRYGSINGYAADVKDACELLGERAPEYGLYRDSRGINRGILRDYQGAIEDFEYAITWFPENGYQVRVKTREDWLVKLEVGQNPFDAATLEMLKAE